MKKHLTLLATLLLSVSIWAAKPVIPLYEKAAFDTIMDGQKVSLYTITNGTVTAQVTNYGAFLTGHAQNAWTVDECKPFKHTSNLTTSQQFPSRTTHFYRLTALLQHCPLVHLQHALCDICNTRHVANVTQGI